MKKLLIALIILFANAGNIIAASPTPLASPTASPTAKPLPVSSATMEKAKELKEKVASKIAELKVIQKRAFLGTIKSKTDKGLILTVKNKDYTVETDTDTKIISLAKGVRKNIKLSDLTKDQKIVLWGQYNKDQESLKAKEILLRSFSLNLLGTVRSIDKDSLTVLDKDENKEYIINIGPANKKILKKDKSTGKIDSKDIGDGDFVHIYATAKTEGDKTTYQALRVLDIPKTLLETFGKETPKPTPIPKATPTPKP